MGKDQTSDLRSTGMLFLQIGASRVALKPGVYDIGRALDCQISVGADGVSRSHARIQVDDSHQAVLSDLGSTNGTFVNGQRLEPHGTHQLSGQDVILVGRCEIRVGRAGTGELPGGDAGDDQAVTAGPYRSIEGRRPTVRREPLLDVQTCAACRQPFASQLRACPRCGLESSQELPRVPRTTGTVRATRAVTAVAMVGLATELEEALRSGFSLGGGVQLGAGPDLPTALARLEVPPHLVLVDLQVARTAKAFPQWRSTLDANRLGLFGNSLEDEVGGQLARGLGAGFYLSQPASPIMFVAKIRFAISRLDR